MIQQYAVNAIYAALVADSGAGGVAALTGGRIYDTQAPDPATVPFLVFQRATDGVKSTLAEDTADFELQVDCYGTTAAGMAVLRGGLTERVITLLSRSAVNYSTCYARIVLIGGGRDFVEGNFLRVMLRFQVYAC